MHVQIVKFNVRQNFSLGLIMRLTVLCFSSSVLMDLYSHFQKARNGKAVGVFHIAQKKHPSSKQMEIKNVCKIEET